MGWTRSHSMSSPSIGASDRMRTIAERSAAAVWAQLPVDAAHMNAAELRGYVRARAAAAVREQLNILAAEAGEPSPLALDTLRVAVDRTVHLVMRRQLLDLHAPQTRRMAA